MSGILATPARGRDGGQRPDRDAATGRPRAGVATGRPAPCGGADPAIETRHRSEMTPAQELSTRQRCEIRPACARRKHRAQVALSGPPAPSSVHFCVQEGLE